MDWVAAVATFAALEFFFFGIQVGRARVRTGVKAPATTGNEEFERYFRVQYNTLELLVMFYPGLWAFAVYINSAAAAGIGAVYLIGRMIYYSSYIADPEKRGLGFGLSALPVLVLLVGGLGGALIHALGRI